MDGSTMTLLFMLLMGAICLLFMYFYHEHSQKMASNNHTAWTHVLSAHASARAQAHEEREKYLHYIDQLTKWNAAMAQQCQQNAAREINEVKQYMEVFKQETVTAVSDAVEKSKS